MSGSLVSAAIFNLICAKILNMKTDLLCQTTNHFRHVAHTHTGVDYAVLVRICRPVWHIVGEGVQRGLVVPRRTWLGHLHN